MQKIYRLSNNSSYNYIYKKGKSCSSKHLVLLYVPTKYSLKVGFSVSKKVGNAVVRNRTKRRLKNSFMSLIPSIDNHHNYVVVTKVGAGEASYMELLNQLSFLLKKSGMLSQNMGIIN